jgi:uncharacterized protein YkwD
MRVGYADSGRALESRRLLRLIRWIGAVTAALLAVFAGLPWLSVITPRWVMHRACIIFLWSLLLLFCAAIPATLIGGFYSLVAVRRGVRRRDRALCERALRWFLLAATSVVGLLATELASATKLRWASTLPKLPTEFRAPASKAARDAGTAQAVFRSAAKASRPGPEPAAGRELYLVVIGESSARGEPYHPWISLGQIVEWQLRRVFPEREVRVETFAEGGLCLDQAVLLLRDLTRRPDAIVVFGGHNEFQTRYGWSRNVRHYAEEGPESRLALLELARSASSSTKLILETLDRVVGETPPPDHAGRELVDHPSCSPWEYRFLVEDFHRRLDALADFAKQIGALLILVVPPSNDGAFEPNRSVLAGSTPVAARLEFEREFRRLRGYESTDPEAAIAGYRRLTERHPEFAESHYRLGRLLARAGEWEEAKSRFARARDLDRLPLRCPDDFRTAIRSVAAKRGAILIDSPTVMAHLVPDGILDDRLFHDAHHPNLAGYVALAQEVLDQLQERRSFGWPDSTRAPRVELGACFRHFGLDAERLSEVCERSALFYARTAHVRYDPSERLELADRYHRAAGEIARGRPPSETGIPGLSLETRAAPLFQAPGQPERLQALRGALRSGHTQDKRAADVDLETLIAAHNRIRAESKLPPLETSRLLVQAAQIHAADMARHGKAQHEGSDGSDPFARLKRLRYRFQTAGENIADGQNSIAEVMDVWINSPDHRKNILGDYTEIGAAVARDASGHPYWCVDFGRPWPKLDSAQESASLISALNQARVDARRPKVKLDQELARVARRFARDSAASGKLASKNSDGQSPFDVLKRQGYHARQFAYSFSSGQSEPAEVVRWWLERTEDRAVVLGRFDRAGAGVAAAEDGTPYWVVLLAQKQ